jgi:hypothetical protein
MEIPNQTFRLNPCQVSKSSSIQLATSLLCADLPGHLILTPDLGELPRLAGNPRLSVSVNSSLMSSLLYSNFL